MDQVKAALAWLKKHHFWVLTLLVIGAVVGVWYTASASVASQTKAAMDKINNEFNSVSGLANQPFKPNEAVNAGQAEETKKLAADVLREWGELYKVQKNEVLIWPEELPKRFIDDVQDKKFGDEIQSRNREFYLNYIKDTFPSLVKIVDARLYDESNPGAGGGGGEYGGGGRGFGGEFGGGGAQPGPEVGPDGEPLESHLVEWLDQGDLRARLVPQTVPSSLSIWALQEDLWVYTTLLKAIAATNKESGASRRERAAVQTILSMKVGRPAAASDSKSRGLVPPDAEETSSLAFGEGGEFGGGGYGGEFGGGGEYGGGGGEFGGGEYGGGGGEFGGEAGLEGEGADPATVLLAGRYIDETGAPVASVPPDYNFGREFKRLPVAMTLEMDTKYLSTLMWELANAPLQVEVKEVRFNPEGDVGGGGAAATQAFGAGGSSGEVSVFNRRPSVGIVTVRGIVYLFNPPDPSVASGDGGGGEVLE